MGNSNQKIKDKYHLMNNDLKQRLNEQDMYEELQKKEMLITNMKCVLKRKLIFFMMDNVDKKEGSIEWKHKMLTLDNIVDVVNSLQAEFIKFENDRIYIKYSIEKQTIVD